jgi:uncharacterized HAD superfamily protein
MKFNIAFDIDNTITDGKSLYDFIAELHPTFDENKHYDVYPITTSLLNHGFLKEEIDYLEFIKNNEENIYLKDQLFPGVLEFISKLKDDGHNIFFITARSKDKEVFTKELFERYNIIYENVYHLESYDKTMLSEELNIDFFFEDNVNNATNLLSVKSIKKIFLMKAPYNIQALNDNKQIIKFDDWHKIYEVFNVEIKKHLK